MYTTLWLKQSWTDDRLAWNPDDSLHGDVHSGLHMGAPNNIKLLRLPAEEVWKPDLSNYNGKIEHVRNSVNDEMTRVVINPEGKVTYVPTLKVNGQTCSMESYP